MRPLRLCYSLLSLIACLFVFVSCERNDTPRIIETPKTYEKDTKLRMSIPKPSNSQEVEEPNQQTITIESQITLNSDIPDNIGEAELRTFLEQNLSSLNGEIVFTVDDEIIYRSVVTNGVESIIIGPGPNGPTPSGDGCSFDGIRECANETLYEMGTVSKFVCAFEFWACYAQAVADCIEEHCINEEYIPIDIIEVPNGAPHPEDPYTSKLPGIGTMSFFYGENIDRMKLIINNIEPGHTTLVYFNSGTDEYYQDAELICKLPDGFYSTNKNTVYEIKHGKFQGQQTINLCPNCDFATLPPLQNPFGGCAPK